MGRSSRILSVDRPRRKQESREVRRSSVPLRRTNLCVATHHVAVRLLVTKIPDSRHPTRGRAPQMDTVKHETTTGQPPPARTAGRPRFTRNTLRLRPRSLKPLEEGPVNDHILRRDRVYRRALAYADTAAAAAALFVAVMVLGDNDTLRPAALLALPIVVIASKLIGLYDRDELRLRKSTLEEAPALFQLATLYALVIWLLAGTFVDGELGRSQLFGLWGCLFGFTILCRALARAVAGLATEPERCLVLGETETTESLCRKLEEGKGLQVTVVGRLPLHVVTGRRADLAKVTETIQREQVHRVILAPGSGETDDMLDAIRLVKALGVRVSVLPRVLEVVGSSVEFDD